MISIRLYNIWTVNSSIRWNLYYLNIFLYLSVECECARANLFNRLCGSSLQNGTDSFVHQLINSFHLTQMCITSNLSYIYVYMYRCETYCDKQIHATLHNIINRPERHPKLACRDNQTTCLGTISAYRSEVYTYMKQVMQSATLNEYTQIHHAS